MTIKIKANDSFMDGRVGFLHSGETTTTTEATATDLEKAGLVKIVAEKAAIVPENKMVKAEKIVNKASK